MDFHFIAWCALLSIVLPLVGLKCVGGEAINVPREDKPWLRKIGALLLMLGMFCSLIMVLQGLHMWNTWEGLSATEVPTSAAAKARGKGGIVLLIINFWPQVLVFGYGYFIWIQRYVFKYFLKLLK